MLTLLINEQEFITSVDNEYDSQGRLSATGMLGTDTFYYYDESSQVVRVDNRYGRSYTRTYSYDERGNLTQRKSYRYTRNERITTELTATTDFTYAENGWKDRLTAVNGTALTYDANGNVLTYGDREYTWTNGRNLAEITEGEDTYSYTYDENGIRTSKTVNGVTTYYNTQDGVILTLSPNKLERYNSE